MNKKVKVDLSVFSLGYSFGRGACNACTERWYNDSACNSLGFEVIYRNM